MRTISTALVLAGVLTLAKGSLFAATRTITGTVSDAMCGAKHAIADTDACVRDCLKKGSDYALVVNGAVYTLKVDKKAKARLSKLVGKGAVVVGDFEDQTVTVVSVSKQKKLRKH